jgi:hypothetical protein
MNPREHKAVQVRILEHAEVIGWKFEPANIAG